MVPKVIISNIDDFDLSMNNGNYKSGGSFGLELNNQGAEYNNPVIESTKPAVYEITIRYAIPVRLSTANISIFN
ncbi:uncharacterized protein OCT59_021305 [Rhizophagus irregularis]|uniref:uncharacterized protein n=1 Tax=Rhizophagus irregularis TaxID=588596 RepID=UPI0033340DD6|nr:hypothetical protein OCT59_021305 [Rhizophagus irregularis]